MSQSKSAFLSIVGRPNTGKSSLLNAMLGQKIAIVSAKPQTTRTKITGVLTRGETQLVFIDTPGNHKPRTKLGETMIKSISDAISGTDGVVLVVEARPEITAAEQELLEKIKKNKLPAVLVINKTDVVKEKENILKTIVTYTKEYDFVEIIPLSAKTGDGVPTLIEALEKLAVMSPHFFDDDALTDQPERVIVSEIIREKMLYLLQQEIPHSTAVSIERMKEREDKNLVDIDATIFCERDSHKAIIIGKRGEMLKRIGSGARVDIERFLDCAVNLKCWVKVKEDWRNRPALLRNFGFDNN